MLGSPSDVTKEINIAKDIIRNWSETNSEYSKIVLLPLHWSTNAYPEIGSHPQKSLDKQLVDRSDLLVCIFASKIGTKTDTADSGSIEEIEEHIKSKKPVMLYFRKKVDITNISAENIEKLNTFKDRMKDKALWWEYEDENEFKDIFARQLQDFLNKHWLQEKDSLIEKQRIIESGKKGHAEFSSKELIMFKKWATGKDQTYLPIRDRAGLTVFLGTENGYSFHGGEEEADYKDFIKRLLSEGYIDEKGSSKNGDPIFEITRKGYEFVKSVV